MAVYVYQKIKNSCIFEFLHLKHFLRQALWLAFFFTGSIYVFAKYAPAASLSTLRVDQLGAVPYSP